MTIPTIPLTMLSTLLLCTACGLPSTQDSPSPGSVDAPTADASTRAARDAPATASPAAGDPAAPADGRTHVDFRVVPFVDLYQYVRAQAVSRAGVTASDDFLPAIEAARAIEAIVGSIFLGWGFLDARLAACDDLDGLVTEFEDLPEEIPLRFGGTMVVRDEAIAFARALRDVEDVFLRDVWPDHRASIERALAGLEERFVPRETECFDYMLSSLGMTDPEVTIPVYLVHESPWPGAVTYNSRAGPLCFVTADPAEGTLLDETVLHESTHALDVSAQPQTHVLGELRDALLAAGLSPRDRTVRDMSHHLMFVQAAETIRRFVSPDHVHYGDADGYYDRVPHARDIAVPIWLAHLDGDLSREQAVKRIVDETLAARR